MFQQGRYNLSEIAIPKGMRKKLTEYTTNIDFVRGVKYTKKYLPEFGSNIQEYERVLMIFVDRIGSGIPKTDVICCSAEDVDEIKPYILSVNWEKHFERNIVKPTKNILDIININFDEVIKGVKQKSLLSFV